MKPQAYAMLAARQQTYWWHRARRDMSVALLRRFGLQQGCRWLDLGCGPGGNLAMLDGLQPALVAGVDFSPIALELARERAPSACLIRTDITRGLPFADAVFDLVTVFNVLYHRWVESEQAVLKEIFRVLVPGGLVLMTEPAFAVLERDMDTLAMGRRRYRLRDIAGLCAAARLNVVFGSYFTSFGFPMLLAVKLANHFRKPQHAAEPPAPAADMKPLPPLANAALYRTAHAEARLVASGVRIPFGVTLVCLARRPS